MIVIVVLLVVIFVIGMRKKTKRKIGDPLSSGSKNIAKERLMNDKLLKDQYMVAISKKRYHKIGCRYAQREGELCSVFVAKERKLLPCKVCHP